MPKSIIFTYCVANGLRNVAYFITFHFLVLQNLQNNQFETISELEQEVMAMKLKHTDAIQDLKVHFLGEKKQYAHQTGTKSAMAKRVSTVSLTI